VHLDLYVTEMPNITIREWKEYEYLSEKEFFEELKKQLNDLNYEWDIHLIKAFMIWNVEFDGMVVIENNFYIIEFKDYRWLIDWVENWPWYSYTWIWTEKHTFYRDKNPFQQCSTLKAKLFQKIKQADIDKDKFDVKTILCFSKDAKIWEWPKQLAENRDWFKIYTIDQINWVFNVLEQEKNIGIDINLFLKWLWLIRKADVIIPTKQNETKDERDMEFESVIKVDISQNLVVQAWPWCWKTFFLVNRLQELSFKWVNVWWVIIITFSKNAALELENRIIKLWIIPETLWKVWTIHSFCNDLLKKLWYFMNIWYTKEPIIIDDYKLSKIIESLWIKKEMSEMIGYLINKHNGNLSQFNDNKIYFEDNRYKSSGKEIKHIFEEVRKFIITNNYLTHDFSLLFAHEMLYDKTYKKEIKKIGFSHILVDEFQDVSRIQFEIIKWLWICTTMVGDKHQAIYAFRWASSESFMRAEQEINNLKKWFLTYNSRSGKYIVNTVNTFLQRNYGEYYKSSTETLDQYMIKSYRQSEDQIINKEFKNDLELQTFISQTIIDLVVWWIEPSDIAILSRSYIDTMTQNIVKTLKKHEIECNFKPKMIIENQFVRDICMFLEIVYAENLNMFHILFLENKINKNNIMKKRLETIDFNKINRLDSLIFTIKKIDQDNRLNNIIETLKAINTDLKKCHPNKSIQYYYENIFLPDLTFKERNQADYYEFIVSKLFDIWEEAKWFANFFDKVQSTELIDSNRTWVKCMTIHGSKWLERKHVFLLWMYEWIYPSPRAELFDELNIGYVAISRAKECLYIPYSLFHDLKATQLSDEIRKII